MILLLRNHDPLYKLVGAQSVFNRYAFHIALANSLVLHLIVFTCVVALITQNKSQLHKPVQLTVQLIKVVNPVPIVILKPVITATQVPAYPTKSQMKKALIPLAKTIQNPQPSSHTHSSNNQTQTEPTQTSTVSLSPLSEPEIETPAIASTHLAATSPTSTPYVFPVLTPALVSSNATTPNIAPVKIGVSISASYVNSNRKPEYPVMSRRLNEQGKVTLRVLVTENGTAGLVEVKTSSSYPLLDESARSAVMQWHFNPATIDGKPISEFYSLTIPFKLE